MSRALRESGSPFDIPRFIFKTVLWGWFIYRSGEEVLYYVLDKLSIPHTPKWRYDPNKKYSDNMSERERWKKSKLFDPSSMKAIASSTGSGKKPLAIRDRE